MIAIPAAGGVGGGDNTLLRRGGAGLTAAVPVPGLKTHVFGVFFPPVVRGVIAVSACSGVRGPLCLPLDDRATHPVPVRAIKPPLGGGNLRARRAVSLQALAPKLRNLLLERRARLWRTSDQGDEGNKNERQFHHPTYTSKP
jgi:hypothetical protein